MGLTPTEDSPTLLVGVADGRQLEAKQVMADTVRVGKFTARDVRCGVMPPEASNAPLLLGLSFFSNFNFKIDSAKGELIMAQIGGSDTEEPDDKSSGRRTPVRQTPSPKTGGPDESPERTQQLLQLLTPKDGGSGESPTVEISVGSGAQCQELTTPDPCGGLFWVEKSDTGEWKLKPEIVGGVPQIFETARLHDLDQDGLLDLIASSFGADGAGGYVGQTQWFPGNPPGGFAFNRNERVVGEAGGPRLTVHDVDIDGDMDLVFGDWVNGGWSWYENQGQGGGAQAGNWGWFSIAAAHGPGYVVTFVDDLYGDGVTMPVGTNHTNTARETDPDPWRSEVFVFGVPADPTMPWTPNEVSTGMRSQEDTTLFEMNAPGEIVATDIDGDGDIDLVVAGLGDPEVYLLQQVEGEFVTQVLRAGMTRSAGLHARDLDSDGDDEIVVLSQLQNVLYALELK